jgi:hypothetical protein
MPSPAARPQMPYKEFASLQGRLDPRRWMPSSPSELPSDDDSQLSDSTDNIMSYMPPPGRPPQKPRQKKKSSGPPKPDFLGPV